MPKANKSKKHFRMPEPYEKKVNVDRALLRSSQEKNNLSEISSAPLFPEEVIKHQWELAESTNSSATSQNSEEEKPMQYGMLAGNAEILNSSFQPKDEAIFYNVSTPSSVFICGSQGSGKSHTLSCILENCLIKSSRIGNLSKPLTGLVFHFDTFSSRFGGGICEAAHLASDKNVKVRVLCSPSNITTIKVATPSYASKYSHC